jgi:carbon monoxide dehydrogenase subunit G
MKVELEKTFPVPGSVDASWEFLQNIEGVAGCMPGAKITERIDDTHFKGTISVRVGPAGMAFKGEIEVKALEAATRTLHLVGKGSDTSGTSGASMDLVARIDPGATEGTSNLVGRSEVTMSGKAAAFGGRMMGSVADQILKQFAANFATQVQARSAGAATAMAPATATATAEPDATAVAAPPHQASTVAASVDNASASPAVAAGVGSPPANELNALAVFWAILRDWFRGLFRRKPA